MNVPPQRDPSENLPPLLANFPVALPLPVIWGDQDAFGHVNNTVFLRWFEAARVAYLERIGLDRMPPAARTGPILARVTCDFRRQVNYPDQVTIGAKVARLGNTSLTMHHAIFSAAQQAVVAEGDSVVVLFDYEEQRPISLPESLRAAIRALEGAPEL
jgi:acyl-CoA thioester hydrolase